MMTHTTLLTPGWNFAWHRTCPVMRHRNGDVFWGEHLGRAGWLTTMHMRPFASIAAAMRAVEVCA